jgi:hypothetical protein
MQFNWVVLGRAESLILYCRLLSPYNLTPCNHYYYFFHPLKTFKCILFAVLLVGLVSKWIHSFYQTVRAADGC